MSDKSLEEESVEMFMKKKLHHAKPHPDSGDVVVAVIMAAVMFIVIFGLIMAGFYKNNEQPSSQQTEVIEPDPANHAQLCIDEVLRVTKDEVDPRIMVKVNEVLPDNGHRVLFVVDRTFETDATIGFLDCTVDRKGKVTMQKISEEKAEELAAEATSVLDEERLLDTDGTESVVAENPNAEKDE